MRGCLSVLIIAAIFVGVGAWFGGPPIAEALVRTGLTSAGMHSDDLKVDVKSAPPLRLAVGRADEIDVDGTGVEWNGLTADTLHLVLEDVDFLGRSAAHVEGRLTGVELPNVDPPGSKATVDIKGPGDAAVVTITIDEATVERMAAEAFQQKLGVRPKSTTLSEPNVIRFTAGPVTAAGALTIGPDGSLGVSTPLGTVTVLRPSPSQPIQFTSVAVEGGNLVLTGTFDVGDLF
jgi:hypothetical protein